MRPTPCYELKRFIKLLDILSEIKKNIYILVSYHDQLHKLIDTTTTTTTNNNNNNNNNGTLVDTNTMPKQIKTQIVSQNFI